MHSMILTFTKKTSDRKYLQILFATTKINKT